MFPLFSKSKKVEGKKLPYAIKKYVTARKRQNEGTFANYTKRFGANCVNFLLETKGDIEKNDVIEKGVLERINNEKSASCDEYTTQFMKEEKRELYECFSVLKERCLKRLKKLKCDMFLLTSSNREYVPYYFYDFFITPRLVENDAFMEKEKKNRMPNRTEEWRKYYINNELYTGKEKNELEHFKQSKEIQRYIFLEQFVTYRNIENIPIDSYIKFSLQKNFQIKYLTAVQYCLLPFVLENYDMLINSVRGSGKTIAYMISLLHKMVIQMNSVQTCLSGSNKLNELKQKNENSFIFALIICPNIILVEQTYSILKKLVMYHPYNIKCHYLHGRKTNMNMKKEVDAMKRKKPNVIVTTPISFMNHMKFSNNFVYQFFLCDTLIIDEAYFLLNENYLKNVLQIKKVLPKGHQTILLTTIANNFLKQICFRLLRLNYIYLNFVDNAIYEVKENIEDGSFVKDKLSEEWPFETWFEKQRDEIPKDLKKKEAYITTTPFCLQLYHKINASMLATVCKDSILNCDDIGKLWFSKNARTFFEKVSKTGVYIGKDDMFLEKNDVVTQSMSMKADKNNVSVQKEYIFPYAHYENSFGNAAIENISKCVLRNSDYNRYRIYNDKADNTEIKEMKGKNIPTHIFLKQEYLIYESDKLGLLLFNILYKEFLNTESMKIVIFFPTVKMLQFFYSLFKHYIFKGYLFLLYMKLNMCGVSKSNKTEIGEQLSNFATSYIFEETESKQNSAGVSSKAFCINTEHMTYKNTRDKTDNTRQRQAVEKDELKDTTNVNRSKREIPHPHTTCIEVDGVEEDEDAETFKEYSVQLDTLKDVHISCLHSKLSLERKLQTLQLFNGLERKKQILFTSSLLCQGIEINNVDLVIQIGISNSLDEYILRTQIATNKNTYGKSLLLLNELEGHYLFILYKNSIMINNVSAEYLKCVYKENKLLNLLLKYKKKGITTNTTSTNTTSTTTTSTHSLKTVKISDGNAEEIRETEKDTTDNIHVKTSIPIKHIEWHSHKHLRASCELMYRSMLGFYCEKNKYLKYEKWQVPSLIKSILHSFGFFENFCITKAMAARLQILNAPDVLIQYYATSKSVLLSALPTYKGYISRMHEYFQRKTEMDNTNQCLTKPISYDAHLFSMNKVDTFDMVDKETKEPLSQKQSIKELSKGDIVSRKCSVETMPLYFPIQKYLS